MSGPMPASLSLFALAWFLIFSLFLFLDKRSKFDPFQPAWIFFSFMGIVVLTWFAFLGILIFAFQAGLFYGAVLISGPALSLLLLLLVEKVWEKEPRGSLVIFLSVLLIFLGFHAYGFYDSYRTNRFSTIVVCTRDILQANKPSFSSPSGFPTRNLLIPCHFIVINNLSSDSSEPSYTAPFDVSNRSPANGLTAERPSEVTTVLAVIGYTQHIRSYTPSGSDRAWVFDCHVVDLESSKVLESRRFNGSVPGNRSGGPATVGPNLGSQPWEEVDQWLTELIVK